MKNQDIKSHILFIVLLITVGLLRYYNFILFHTVAEFFSIIVAFVIFITAWNTQEISENDYLYFLGITYFFVGIIDLGHTLTYKGMNIFIGLDSNLPTQLWIIGRAIESTSLLVAPFYTGKKFPKKFVMPAFLLVTLILLSSILIFNIFPVTFVEGSGLTFFKKVSEYIISLILLLAIITTGKKKKYLGTTVYHYVLLSLLVTIFSELLFTVYVDLYGISNFIGHLSKIVSFYFIYKAMVQMTLIDPFSSLFRELHHRERDLRSLIDKFPLPIMITRKRENIEFLNVKFTDMFGYSLNEIKNLDLWWEYLVPDEKYRIETRKILNREVDLSFEEHRDVPILEMLLTGKNGIVHHCNFFIVYIEGMSLSIMHDITDRIRVEGERKQLEELAVRNEKMLSLGRLTAGTAHEINNPLAGMMQTLYVLNKRLLGNRDLKANNAAAKEAGTSYDSIVDYMERRSIPRMFDSINYAGQRISNIINNMLFFAKDDKLQRKKIDIEKLLKKTLEIALTDPDMKLISRTIEVDENIPKVFCVSSRIQQVLLNILRNSTQALTESLWTDPVISISLKYLESSGEIEFRIADNGPGMSEDIKKRIFEPFYTTREVGSGSGLGLSVSYFIITDIHKGHISVHSEPGEGSEFLITIPVNSEN